MEATYETPDESWRRLRRTIEDYQVAVFLGAGVSAANDLPNWGTFIQELGEWSTEEMADFAKSGVSLMSLCEIAKHQKAAKGWTDRVRDALYGKFLEQIKKESGRIPGLNSADFSSRDEVSRARVDRFFRERNPVLWDIVCACGYRDEDGKFHANDNIGALLTTNLDGLPQLCDRAVHGRRLIRTVERASTESHLGKIPLYQLHGYLMPPGVSRGLRGEAADGFVLTESEYLGRTDGPYTWANVTLHFVVREMPVIFIGCSMTDDLIRRALLRSRRERADSFAATQADREALQERLIRRHFIVMSWNPDDDRANCIKNIGAAMLGAWPLWISNYDRDLPARVRAAVSRRQH